EAKASGLTSEQFACHGHLSQPQMRAAFARCHAVIVPTTSDFIEGFNQVVVEAILASRPVVTSRICLAIRYVRKAVIEVPPDDAAAYGDALLQLADDEAGYARKRQACLELQERFYDPRNGWKEAFRTIIRAILEDRDPAERILPVEPDPAQRMREP